ncbi:MAG: hypothetical protein JOY82_02710 [Streptosporangiaceae bacterium]|nr:hypothetical protein [Streptosporangiaceae bacterium]MBV9853421.1 hypothetical protein [Streptosporangiaceae bacterium]
MNDPGKITWPNGNRIGDYPPDNLWTLDDFTADGEPPAADATGGLVSLGFIKASLVRRRRLWCITAAAGALIGCGLYLKSPPAYQASASLLLTPGPYENITTAANNEQAMAQSETVAGLAVRNLGLHQSAGSFLATYKVTPITERLVVVTASAPSSGQAVLDAGGVAAAYLEFRAQKMEMQQAVMVASLDQEVKQAQDHLNSVSSQISRLPAQPASPARQSQLKALQAAHDQAATTLLDLRQAAIGNQISNGSATAAAVKGSVVLDPAAPLAHSRLKPLAFRVAIGLILGLALGLSIVIIQEFVSDRLRRRDDVAQALGAPVRLSVRTGRLNRWAPGLLNRWAPGFVNRWAQGLLNRWAPGFGARSAARAADVERIAAHLGRAMQERPRGVAALAVVPVDDVEVPALSLVSLAVSCARGGKQVVVADLCGDAPMARLLGAAEPGVRVVNTRDTSLVVAVPEPGDVVPVGPLDHGPAQDQRSSFTEAVAAACAAPSVLLTLVSLDPSLGGEHIATWAADAVTMVTAGRSSWTRIHGAGEMIRLSGARLASAVLLGADGADESLGVAYTPETLHKGLPAPGRYDRLAGMTARPVSPPPSRRSCGQESTGDEVRAEWC